MPLSVTPLLLTALLAPTEADAVRTNLGPVRPVVSAGHVLTSTEGPGQGMLRVLYAPADEDDPQYRAQIAQITGGIVDYFDARVDTPDLMLLLKYDAIETWVNFPYADNALFGDLLAEAAFFGKCIILGYGCAQTAGNSLAGQIMTPAYSPVFSPTGLPHTTPSPYNDDGVTCIWSQMQLTLNAPFRDTLQTWGAGAIDGTYQDTEITAAFNDPGNGVPSTPPVIYLNGAAGSNGTDIPCWVAGAFSCHGIEIDPDECPEDINDDQQVNIQDVLFLLSEWDRAGGLADVNYDGIVNIRDLLGTLGAWGDCQAP